jgi:hypothetical protein
VADQAISKPGPTILEDCREQAHRWSGQLGRLFGWLFVMEFGLVSVVLGVLVVDWPETPEFLATAAGAWLLLLAGCRAFGLLAERPVDSPVRTASWPRLVAGFAAAFCVGTGYVLMHADWPTRPAAIPTALTFGAVTIGACGVLDVMVARFGPRAAARTLLVRAGGWIAAALVLMALLSSSPPAALACAAVVIGVVELGRGAYELRRAVAVRADSAVPEEPVDDRDPFTGLWLDDDVVTSPMRLR